MSYNTVVYLTVCILEELTVQTASNIVSAPDDSQRKGNVKLVNPELLKVTKEIRLPFFVRDLHLPGIRVKVFNSDLVYQYTLSDGAPVAIREDNDKVVKLIRRAIAEYDSLGNNTIVIEEEGSDGEQK